jgi:hypothetical protein
MEKESPKAILAHHAPQFPENEERNESAKDDDSASEQVVDAYVMKRSSETFSMDKVLDHLLKNMECKDKQAEHKRFPNSRIKQSLSLELCARVYGFSDQNHLGDDDGVKQRRAIDEIRNVKLVQQKHAVGRQGAKEESEIQRDDGKFLKLIGNLLFHTCFPGIFSVHLVLPF